jgi:hypothetical protein
VIANEIDAPTLNSVVAGPAIILEQPTFKILDQQGVKWSKELMVDLIR